MFGPDDLAAALRSRRRSLRSIRPQSESPFLTSWRAWLHAAPTKAASPGYSESTLRDVLVTRAPPKRPPASRMQLTRWQSFRSMFRQSWDGESDGNRRLRIGSAIASLVINLFFAAMLLWLMYLRFMARPTHEEDLAIQVQLIGQGAPEEEGGGTPQPQPEITTARATQHPTQAKASASAAPQSASVEQVHTQSQTESVATMAMQAPQTPAHPAPSEPLPPSTPILVAKPTEAVPKFTQPPQKMPTLPTPVAVQPQELHAQALPTPPEPEPLAQASLPNVQAQVTAMPTLSAKAVKPINLPPAPTAASGASSAAPSSAQAASTAGSNSPLRGTSATTGAPSTTVGNGSGINTGRGVGAGTQAKTGGPPTPLKGDDWGASSRNVAGQPHGAINGNRGGGTSGQYDTSGVAKYGADQFTARIKDPYKEGSWVKRQVRKDDATIFEPYWVPHENLLEEWVRKGIKEIEIPLGSDGKRVIKCQISILQLGGGCGIAGGINGVKDNPARARKPPAVPFKSKYFDDPSALGAPEKGAEVETPAQGGSSSKP
ncbi:hypothetical protein [Solilutibacter silvestris]|uniref:Transmembrane protein n=1 Tax=Solilutibacter silvestris TaxID=1645665 RepID=A0A2K1PYK2_9GAMM|nr:hypothetical protein [Lysobacter silvestris]PNS07853.1 hypothetical protein Lysil_2029 [Lysobacter silvestris]